MAVEKSWLAVAPQLFTADGNTLGIVNIASTAGFKVKQVVVISQGTPSTLHTLAQVKRVVSSTQMIVGPIPDSLQPPQKQQGSSLLSKRLNISAYTVASGSYVYAEELPKVIVPMPDILQAVYRQEPGTTIGVEIDDQFGTPISAENPLPVSFDGTIAIGDVSIVEGGNTMVVNPDGSINVDATIEGGAVEIKGLTGNIMAVNPDGSINVDATVTIPSGTIPTTWTEIDMDYDSNNNLIEVQYYNGVPVERTLTLSYDANNNLKKVIPS